MLLRDAVTGEAVACQRFVLPERLLAGRITQVECLKRGFGIDLAARPRDTWAEVSRTSILEPYRWGSTTTTMSAIGALKYAPGAVARGLERDALYSVSEPTMARLTRTFGVPLHRCSPNFEYYGRRAAFRIDVDELFASVPADKQDLVDRLIAHATRV